MARRPRARRTSRRGSACRSTPVTISCGPEAGTEMEASRDPTLVADVDRCPYCQRPDRRVMFERDLLKIVACPGCGLWYTAPRWNAEGLTRFYDGPEYFTGRAP